MAAEKVSITVERELLDEVRGLAGGNVSQWFARAAQERLQREHRQQIVAEDLAAHGPIPDEVREDVLRQWPRA